jgi:hypothetical protein
MTINKTRIYPNHSSAHENRGAVNEMIVKELRNGRYHGPYSKAQLEAILGPFISHPLGAVPKSDGIRWRIIEDLSWPRNSVVPSVNDLSDYSDVPVEWGGMAEMIKLVITAKKGAQGATVDWEDAFRQLPIKRDELWMGVVQWNVVEGGPKQFYVDGNAKFGHNRSIGTFGKVNKAFATLIEKEGFADVIYWVDDLCARREPINKRPPWRYEYDINDILSLAKFLGIPLPEEKVCDYSNITRYLGFDWHWDTKEVTIPKEKKTKALEQISTLTNGRSVSKEELGSLCGYLAHLAQVVCEGKARMRALYRMHAQIDRKKSVWTSEALQELAWWRNKLQRKHLGMRLCTQGNPDDSLKVYVDASPWGIGVVINGRYDSFQLARGWENTGDGTRRDIGWAEFLAVELAIFFLILGYRIHQRHFLIHTDNQGVIHSWNARRSRNAEHNSVLMRILQALSVSECFISLEWVPSKENPADAASRGYTPLGMKRHCFGKLPNHLKRFLSRI